LRVGVWAFDKGVGHWRMPDIPACQRRRTPLRRVLEVWTKVTWLTSRAGGRSARIVGIIVVVGIRYSSVQGGSLGTEVMVPTTPTHFDHQGVYSAEKKALSKGRRKVDSTRPQGK
jgi:hypothetical protein